MSDSSANSKRCQQCGTEMSAATGGLCPRCLMAQIIQPTQAGEPAAPVPTLTPEQLAPHFPQLEILECLGRGGMGVVYKARQKSLNRLVALKLLAPERVTDAQFAGRFAREAQALAALNHPHIVTVYDFGVVDAVAPLTANAAENAPIPHAKMFFLLMEFVDGVNLRQAMKAGRFTPEQALAIVPPVCEALQYAHEHGIVHRDIKPENLLLDKEGRVKIADFGIAKMLGESSAGILPVSLEDTGGTPALPSMTAGTPQYMSPEQKAHGVTDHRADIYSLGVVLYEMLTGELPADSLQPPSRKVQIDVRLDEIVLRALEKAPELRYQTAGEFRTQLETVVMHPEAPPQQGWFWWLLSRFPKPPLVREIHAHMTRSEKRRYVGLLMLVLMTMGAPLGFCFSSSNPGHWILGAILFGAMAFGLQSLLTSMVSWLLCSTAWARQQGITPALLKGSASAPAAPPAPIVKKTGAVNVQTLEESERPRFSRTAIVGACWVPILFVALFFTRMNVSQGGHHGPAWWQYLLMFTLLPLGIATPFGTTILGWIAVSQIRRSAGKLHGMWLAVFDGLLFPLLLVDLFLALFFQKLGIAFHWWTQNYDDQSNAALIVWSCITSPLVDFLIIRAIWRAVNRVNEIQPVPRPAPAVDGKPSRGWKLALWCILGALLLGGVVGGIMKSNARHKAMQTRADFHYRVFEADAALVDRLIPVAQRKPGVQPGAKSLAPGGEGGEHTTSANGFTISKHGHAVTDSQVAVIDSATLQELLAGIAKKPGVLAEETRTVTGDWWPQGVGTVWSYSTQADGLAVGGSGESHLASTVDDAQKRIRIEGTVKHEPNFKTDIDHTMANFLYEGETPLAHALAFLVPFFRKDASSRITPGYLVVAYEVLPSETLERTLKASASTAAAGTNVVAPAATPELLPDTKPVWGEPTNGLSISLHADKTVWNSDETPILNVSLRNAGEMILSTGRTGNYLQQVEVDGKWYRARVTYYETTGESIVDAGGVINQIQPGEQWDNVQISLGRKDWQKATADDLALATYPFRNLVATDTGIAPVMSLSPGKHTVRVAFVVEPARAIYGKPAFRVMSNPVEVEIQKSYTNPAVPNLSFGPMIGRTLNYQRSLADAHDVLRLSDGAVSKLPPGFFDHNEKKNQKWLADGGSKIFPGLVMFPDEPPGPHSWGLGSADVEFSWLPDEAWNDSKTERIQESFADKNNALRRWFTQGAMIHCLSAVAKWPATLAFRAGDGSEGVLQILEISETDPQQPIKMKLRYKLVQNGDASSAPMSATAPKLAFGPVVEHTLIALDEKSGGNGLQFETDGLIPLPTKVAELPPLERAQWLRNNFTGNLVAEFPGDYWRLILNRMKVVQVDPKSWDTLSAAEDATRYGKEPVANTCYRFAMENLEPKAAALNPPQTLAFYGDNFCGLLQITGFTENPRGVKIRYRLVQGDQAKPETITLSGQRTYDSRMTSIIFPVIERVLDPYEGKGGEIFMNYLDLDTGSLVDKAPPGDLGTLLGDSDSRVRTALDMKIKEVAAEKWDCSREELVRTLLPVIPAKQTRLGGSNEPKTYFFQTREGGMGVLQILGNSEKPPRVKVRYKLVQRGPEPSANATPTFESVTDAARKLIAKHFQDAIITATEDRFNVQQGTREYEIHGVGKDGNITRDARKEIGPSPDGFMLSVERLKESLPRQPELPQAFNRRYWTAYSNQSFDEKTSRGVSVSFDFGERLNPEFKAAMLELLKLSGTSATKPAAAPAEKLADPATPSVPGKR